MSALFCYPIAAYLQSAVSFSDSPDMGNVVETLPYIPGSALRGALAQAYLSLHGEADKEFRELFVDGSIQFPCLLPEASRHLPQSILTCKHYSGFSNDPILGAKPNHKVVNRLWEDYCDVPLETCSQQDCGLPLIPYQKDFYNGNRPFKVTQAVARLRMSTSVNGTTGSARDGSLHSQRELVADQVFNGEIICSKEDFGRLERALGGKQIKLSLGKKRSGVAEIILMDTPTNPNEPRLFKLTSRPDKTLVAMTCSSDLILVDQLLRPVTCLSSAEFKQIFIPPVAVEVLKAFVSSRKVAGWLAVGKIFKENDHAISAGSTLLLQFASRDEGQVLPWLKKLQLEGIGLRKNEGFGRVSFQDPLHNEIGAKLEKNTKLSLKDMVL